jgi:ribonuclease D
LFHSARWKAYLLKIKDDSENNINEESDSISSLYHKLHAQSSTWFGKNEDNGHQKAAEEHLKRSNELLNDCTNKVDALEETLANTPKPSQMLNWDKMTLSELLGASPD